MVFGVETKENGGSGLKNTKDCNRAIMIKYIRGLTPKVDKLWVKWVHDHYLKGNDWWSYRPLTNCCWTGEEFTRLWNKPEIAMTQTTNGIVALLVHIVCKLGIKRCKGRWNIISGIVWCGIDILYPSIHTPFGYFSKEDSHMDGSASLLEGWSSMQAM